MRNVTCAAARLMMQAPADLPDGDQTALRAHLSNCSECRAIQDGNGEIDRHIGAMLCARVRDTSVRESVLQVLQAEATEQQSRERRRWSLRPFVLAPILAILAVAVSLISPSGARAPLPVSAGWRLVHREIGYPLTVDSARPDHLLAGAWGGVYESWDAGGAWHPLGPLPPHEVIRDLAIDRVQPNRYIVATKHSIFVSTDAGHHWSLAVDSLRGADTMFVLQDPFKPAVYYLGPSVLLKSADHGQTWKPAGREDVFSPMGIQSLDIAPNGNLVTGIWGGGVALSADGGRTWQRRSLGLQRNVMSVAAGSKVLWAATDRGPYVSRDSGLHWHRANLPGRFFNTGVIAEGNTIVVGGDGAVYRSGDGGRHWTLSMSGLPLDPYVYGFIGDPAHPNRLYASLDWDGPFRSDDGGRTWKAISAGLPMRGSGGAGGPVLFRRSGDLWLTDDQGTDPGNLTSGETVRMAALTPDGAAIAYVSGDSGHWRVSVLGAGGSSVRVLTAGTGALPRSLLWAPNASMLAIETPSGVTITDLTRVRSRWKISGHDHLVAWDSGRKDLFFWNDSTHATVARAAMGGGIVRSVGRSDGLPVSSGSGHLATVAHGMLLVGSWKSGPRPLARVGRGCRARSWSDDENDVLLTCPSHIEVWKATGTRLYRAALPANTRWAPGSHDLLFEKNRSLWRWSGSHSIRRIVRGAVAVDAAR